MTTGRARTRSFWGSTLLNVAAALGAVCLTSVLLVAAFGLTPIVLMSDSMAPAVSAGDLAVARSESAGDVGVGEIVSVISRSGERVTHRVQAVDPSGSSIQLTLKADARAAPDAETYTVTRVDKVIFTVPMVGRLVRHATDPVGVVVGGVLVACLSYVVFAPGRRTRATRKAAKTPTERAP